MNFESLGLSAPILRALQSCGYETPTPIQQQAIPPALEGRDVLGCAQTGTGKTCAFGAPILQRLSAKPRAGKGPRALILTPTRELALQIEENLKDYSKSLPLRTAVIFGGVGQAPQVEQLRRGLDVLTATPGRLLDLAKQGLLNLKSVEIFVLDEADRMLDMGFIHDVKKILALLPKQKQTLFFSATMPEEIMELVNSLMQDPVRVAVNPISSPVEVIRQQVYLVDRVNKTLLLADILRNEKVRTALVFTRTKHGADKVTKELVRAGIQAAAIHGNKSQTARQNALAQFKAGSLQVLVATDIAARGIDIEELPYVFNYNLPEVPETYVHRIGRTGRAGRGGTAISFCDHSESSMLRAVEALLARKIDRVEEHAYPMQDFAILRRDAKGRLVNADDEEARSAARDRRVEKAASKSPKAAKPAFGKKAGPALLPQKANKQARDPALAPADTRRRGRRPGGSVDALPAHPAQQPKQTSRRNPLDGEAVMDATARLFAARSPLPKAAQKPFAPKRDGAAAQAKPVSRATRRDPKSGGAAAAVIAEKTHQRSTQNREQTQSRQQRDARGQGTRRRIPTVEGPRSHQKDSTEQHSLMKPFYIEHD